jgi:hypothetical protein
MTTKYQQEEARVAQARLAHVQQFATKLGWNLGREQSAPSLAVNNLCAIEYTHVPVSSPPRLRDTRSPGQPLLADMRTTRLSNAQGRLLAVFSSPEPVIKAAIEAAEASLAKAEETRKLADGSQLALSIPALESKAAELLAAGKHKELGVVAEELTKSTALLEKIRTSRDAAVREAQAKLDAAKADLDLLDRAGHRYLRVERAPWLTANSFSNELIAAHERSETVRAVDSIASIDLTEWNLIDVERAPVPFPVGWLEMLVPVKLPDIKEWVDERYEEIDADAPASAGVGASDLWRAYLEAHGLHATQCSLESFSAVVGEIFNRKRASTGRRFMVQLRLTEAQKEARLRAQFEAEKAAKERAEFEAWKRARAEAAAESSPNGPAE